MATKESTSTYTTERINFRNLGTGPDGKSNHDATVHIKSDKPGLLGAALAFNIRVEDGDALSLDDVYEVTVKRKSAAK